MKNFDIVITGAGPAGLMAAAVAAGADKKTALIEKNSRPGKKLLLTGGGRCNLANYTTNFHELVEQYGEKGKFLYSGFDSFGLFHTLDFFHQQGLSTITDEHNRIYPETEKAGDVLDFFLKLLNRNNVTLISRHPVIDLEIKNNRIETIATEKGSINARSVILATGGKSYPSTGSTGDGYKWLKKMGHTLVPPRPGLSPFIIKNDLVSQLQGISLKDVEVTLESNGKPISNEQGDIIFTHFGISGPAALNLSRFCQPGESYYIKLDLLPHFNTELLKEKFGKLVREHPQKSIVNLLTEFLSRRLATVLLKLAKIEETKTFTLVSCRKQAELFSLVKSLKFKVENISGFKKAMITRGGVDLKEVEPATMKSKIIENLFFAGEILDLDGPTGGFNLQICWTTGFLAGKNASNLT